MDLEGWALSLLLVVGGVVVLNHLGLDLSAAIATTIHGLERALNAPL
jgi:hypothetical protein